MDQKAELPTGWRYVLVLTIPTTIIGELSVFRDHVRESLRNGVLVLPEDCSYCLEIVPDSLCVQAMSAEFYDAVEELFEGPSEVEPEPEPKMAAIPTGRNAEEKRAVQEQLLAYRKSHGLGCWGAVVKASGGKLTDDILRGMVAGTASLPIAVWRVAAKALEQVGAKRGTES